MSTDATPAIPLRAALEAGLSELDARAPQPQRVLVVGGGMAGISTAYWLARAGNAVTVLEAGPAPANGASRSIPGGAASYTGLLAPSSSFAPCFARPHLFRAYKVQWCPKSLFMHTRVGLQREATRTEFHTAMGRLYGLAMWNQSLVAHMAHKWRQPVSDTQAGKVGSSTRPLSLSRVDGTLAVVWDDRCFSELMKDVARNRLIVGDDATGVAGPADSDASTSVIPRPAAGTSAPVARIASLEDDATVAALPTLHPHIFTHNTLAGVIAFRDEFAVDHLSFLDQMRQEAVEKYGVKFQYDTTVTALLTQQQAETEGLAPSASDTASSSSTAVAAASPSSPSSSSPAVAPSVASVSTSASSSRLSLARTSRGLFAADSFVLCAGAHSKLLVHASHLTLALKHPIPTFTTKTHSVAFPNPENKGETTEERAGQAVMADSSRTAAAIGGLPPSSSSSSSRRLLPPTSVLLPESHTLLTAFPTEIRVSSGNDLHLDDDPSCPPAPSAPLAAQEAANLAPTLRPKLEAARLQQILKDVASVFPRVDKALLSQGGTTRPLVSLRCWTFDNRPLMGRYAASVPNLFINGGHGNLGWTHAVAAGHHVSNIVSGLPTFIQPDVFDPRRFDISK